MKMNELLQQTEDLFLQEYTLYKEAMNELDTYRGVLLDTDEKVTIVNDILNRVQLRFVEIYPYYRYIFTRYKMAADSCEQFDELIRSLKELDAHKEKRNGSF